MTWTLTIKFVHILAVAITIGGMFARQVVRAAAKKSPEIKIVAALTQAALRIDRTLVIPWSSLMILVGIALALIEEQPILGFLLGASRNWLLVSNILLVILQALIFGVFVPHNKRVELVLRDALEDERVTTDLSIILNDRKNNTAHAAEYVILILVTALMVLKPF